jgi:ABC-type lipoprotein release transport system permease subunit
MGLVRGVTPEALLVRRQVEISEGTWPGLGEVLVGRLAATKLGVSADELAVGRQIAMEGRSWIVSGVFSAGGSVFESEVWCRLDELQQALKRDDLSISLVALTLAPGADPADVDVFCREREYDLKLAAQPEVRYYESLRRDYLAVRLLAWTIVVLVASAGVFAGLNTMYGAALGRIREFATLQTIGFSRRAILASLLQEGLLLAAAASLLATLLALTLVNGAAVRFTMGAFVLQIDNVAVLIGCGAGILVGVIGAVPPAIRTLRVAVVDALKAV